MNRLLVTIYFLLASLSVIGQAKTTPVAKSELTGIALPAGSKQDKRILSTAAAKTLLEMKADENATKLADVVEVFSLPISMEEQVRTAVQKAGWEIQPYTTEATYSLLKNKGRTILMYLGSSKKETSLYLMPVTSSPQETSKVAAEVTPQTQSQPVAPVQPVVQQSQPQPAVQQQTQTQTPAPVAVVEPKSQKTTATPAQAFTFSTTNFDDGWVSTIASDFVQVTKGDMNVLLYYKFEITDEVRNSNVEISDYYWNKLIVPYYNVKSAVRLQEPGYTYFRTYFIEGEGINPKTGGPCYLALNVLVNSGVATPVLAIAPNKDAYYKQFPEPKILGNMIGYNKFAIAAKDMVGTWDESSGSSVSLYNTTTGSYAGANSAQSYDKFTFNADLSYSSKHSGASSVYGNNTYYTQEYKGKLTVTNWDVTMTKRFKDATEIFNAQFEAVRGGRILHLQNKGASGLQYHLVRVSE